MADAMVTFYFDVRSPYAYLARDEVLALPKDFAVTVDAQPFAIALEDAHGTPETRDERAWRKVKYLYMDVRRFANERGLVIRGTVKVFNPRIAHAAYLYARRLGRERELYDRLLPVFWNRQFDIESIDRFVELLADIKAEPGGFAKYLDSEADTELARIHRIADEAGVFGVPTSVYNGELFWGADRVNMLKRKLTAAGLARQAA
jgi:2-hydroxychromene-2-carboxylate isomerase